MTKKRQPEQSPPKGQGGEFGNFERLTRKLFKVPKRELDEKLRQHEQRQGT